MNIRSENLRAVLQAERNPYALPLGDYAALLRLRGDALNDLVEIADSSRTGSIGNELTYVANRNLDPGRVNLDASQLAQFVEDTCGLGATELCVQGTPGGDDRDAYCTLIRSLRAADTAIHIHAFRPHEVLDGARRLDVPIREFLRRLRDSGVDTVPGTGAFVLDDAVRRRSYPEAIPTAMWISTIRTAHSVGLRSTATLVYGHTESPDQIARHLDVLRSIQGETAGFTEFIPMRYRGATEHDLGRDRAIHAVARLQLHGHIDHIQASWPSIGQAHVNTLLLSGADDIGGLLLDGGRHPALGGDAGTQLSVASIRALGHQLNRHVRQRNTTYGDIPEVKTLLPCGRRKLRSSTRSLSAQASPALPQLSG